LRASPWHRLAAPHSRNSWNGPRASLLDDLDARGDKALADVPGLLERLDIPQLRELWPGGNVIVKR